MSVTSAKRLKNSDFDNDTNENIFSHPYISYMANERLQGEKEFYYKKYLLKMAYSHTKMPMKFVPQKLNFVMAKALSKSYTLDYNCKCSYSFLHSYAY